jgi:hypothetical protein
MAGSGGIRGGRGEARSGNKGNGGGGGGGKELATIEFFHDREILADGAWNAPVPCCRINVLAAKLRADIFISARSGTAYTRVSAQTSPGAFIYT